MADTTNDFGNSNDISILGQILQTPALKEYEKKMCEFNPFAALRLKDYEIRHTNALAWLLDIKGSHGLKDAFLKSFLSIIGRDRGIEQGLNSDKVKVTAEDRFSDNHNGNLGPNRLDIWLEQKDWVIAIEAKINSKEGKNQLGNYLKEIKKRLGGDKYKTVDDDKRIFLFLTVDKKMPENKSKSDDYDRWEAVSWLGLVAESLVFAIKDAVENKSLEENSYKHQFLISYLDVIYEKSTKEFERLETTSNANGQDKPSVLIDRNHRDGYLQDVKALIIGNECFEKTLKKLKDQWESAEKLGRSLEDYCQLLKNSLGRNPNPNNKEQNVLANVQDFQNTFQFLLDQVDSTVEGRMRQIRHAISDVRDEKNGNQVYEILSSSFYRISFIPKAWLGVNQLDSNNRLRCLIEYKREKGEIECKLYFLKATSPGGVIDGNYHAWRQQLWEQLIHDYEPVFVSKHLTQAKKTGYVAGLGDAKIINYEENIDKFLGDINAVLNDRFKPASALIYKANLIVTAPQS